MANPNITLTVIVSGQPVSIMVNPHQKVEHLIREALNESGNKGQAPSEWELRTADGMLIDDGATIEDAGIVAGVTLYLSPKAGAGGSVS